MKQSRLLTVEELKKRAAGIRLLALDVDGTLTDGRINIGPEGELFKSFSCKDGLGISASLRSGLKIAIITGRTSPILRVRAAELGITDDLYCGIAEKGSALRQLAGKYGVTLEETAFMGDDLNDLPALLSAGLAAAPADASEDVKSRCHFVSSRNGGNGAVRELLELILRSQGKWDGIVAAYQNAGQGDRQ